MRNGTNILCNKLMSEELYAAAAVILSPRSASKSGAYSEMSAATGLKAFVKTLAAYFRKQPIEVRKFPH